MRVSVYFVLNEVRFYTDDLIAKQTHDPHGQECNLIINRIQLPLRMGEKGGEQRERRKRERERESTRKRENFEKKKKKLLYKIL